MENQETQQGFQRESGSKSNTWAIVATIAAILLILGTGYWWWQYKSGSGPAVEEALSIDEIVAPSDDSLSAINQALEGITVDSFDEEFQAIDSALEAL